MTTSEDRYGMTTSEDRYEEGTEIESSRIMKTDVFLFLLDLEVKRARRYQNFLSILLLEFKEYSDAEQTEDPRSCYQALTALLMGETRETDIIGTLRENELIILLPYADASAGKLAGARLEKAMEHYNFRGRGYEVLVQQISFPMNGTDTVDLIKKALGAESS